MVMPMLLLAASTVEKLHRVPVNFWLKVAAAIALFILAVVILRKVARMNKAVLCAILFVVVTALGFNWVYERNEPEWATPVVEWLARFFPTKDTQHKNDSHR